MKIFYSPNHHIHNPSFEIMNGQRINYPEVPQRAENIYESLLEDSSYVEGELFDVPQKILRKTHSEMYLKFLESTEDMLDKTYFYPSIFPKESSNIDNKHAVGSFTTDSYVPINSQTYKVVRSSASVAYSAAMETISSGFATYALCRPPGHHSGISTMGGYCYLNNAAVAANTFSSHGRVAMLDVDFHHGNGTQEIFYERNDVLTVSLHAHPDRQYPFFSGRTDEVGSGKGEGYNLNICLDKWITDHKYHTNLLAALDRINEYNPDFLVVSLGFDTYEHDPLGDFKLTTKYYTKMAKSISGINVPSAIIQEGGYNTKDIGMNAKSFLDGYVLGST